MALDETHITNSGSIIDALLPSLRTENPLDISISYPGYIKWLHKPLSDFEKHIREGTKNMEINRDDQIKRIARFYGFTEKTIVAVPSAGEALHTVLQYFTEQGDEILIPEGSYARFPDFVESLAGGERAVRWVDEKELSNLVNKESGDETDRQVVLLEEPRTPAFATPDPDVYLLVSIPGKFRAVLYDAVNWAFNEDISVVRGGHENRLHSNVPFPKSDKGIRVVSTSKILPTDRPVDPFPNVGIIAVGDAIDPQVIQQFRKGIPRKHYRSPSNADLYVMAEILHSELFPKFIEDIRSLAKNNFQFVRDTLGTQTIYDGSNVFVGVNLKGFGSTPETIGSNLKEFGIHALYSQLYFRKLTNGHDTLIRVPIIMDRPNLEKQTLQLNAKLGTIKKLGALINNTPFAP